MIGRGHDTAGLPPDPGGMAESGRALGTVWSGFARRRLLASDTRTVTDKLRSGLFFWLWDRKGLWRALAQRWDPEFTLRIQGWTMRLRPANNRTDARALENGTFPEAKSLEKVLGLLRDGGTLIDVGANCGAFSVPAAAAGARVIALEPNPAIADRLRENLRLNGATADIRDCALGPDRGVATFYVRRSFGLSSLRPDDRALATRDVDLVPLDDLVAEARQRPVVVKVDIEGFEGQALTPFFERADADLLPEAILLETSHEQRWDADLRGALVGRGYTSEFEGDGNTLFLRAKMTTQQTSAAPTGPDI